MSEVQSALSRREFMGRAAGGTLAARLFPAIPGQLQGEPVRRVHVIFKTHLDIGFTDLASRVIDTYKRAFLPVAIDLARETRERFGPRQFKWTVGSWLLHASLEEAKGSERAHLERAMEAGDLCWHAMPFTVHSESLDASLFEAGLQLSRRLDDRFGRTTISAKMTDVPGHTRGVVPLLAQSGVRLLHIGVNPASMPPEVPSLFVWRAPDDSRVVVMYQKDYGGVALIPFTGEAVAIIFTGDNHGPQTADQVRSAYNRLEEQFPGAEVLASNLNAVAETVGRIADQLPVITAELGDSWIHGIGSDPLKMARLREMSRLRREWIQQGKLSKNSGEDLAFSIPLEMIGEHTWGLDVKTHLKSWDVYTPEALRDARSSEPFRRIEASWQEKRDYIRVGLETLPQGLRQEAQGRLEALRPVLPDLAGFEPMNDPGTLMETSSLEMALDPESGALCRLVNKRTGRQWAGKDAPLALFGYQSFGKADYDRFMTQYLTARHDWALQDFGKPGLEAFKEPGRTWLPNLVRAWHRKEETGIVVLAELAVGASGNAVPAGCPEKIYARFQCAESVPRLQFDLCWFGKKANRLPEALWLSFSPLVGEQGRWVMDKMGQAVDPRDVVKNGGHKLHALFEGVHYEDEGSRFAIRTLDAPLVAPGERTLLNFDNTLPPVTAGMHFCLFNNVWGTNFVMWFDEDMRFRFVLDC